MIESKLQLIECLKKEKRLYFPKGRKQYYRKKIQKDESYYIWKFQKTLRKTEYYKNTKKRFRYALFLRKKNIIGTKLGIYIWPNTIDVGLIIYHSGSIVINGHASIGKNCQLHGNNCVGNKGLNNEDAPTIGDNLDMGYGAVVVGKIHLANKCTIGANSIVVKSCYEESIKLAGNPAHKIN